MPKFSIIIPFKSGTDYLQQAVESCLAQTYPDYEVIIVAHDADSTTKDFLKLLSGGKVRIEYEDGINGIEENWKRIHKISKGEFMSILGYDDLLNPNFLHAINNLIQDNPIASLYQTHFNYIDALGNFLRKCKPMPSEMDISDFLKAEFLREMDSTATGYVFRSKDYEGLGGIDTTYPNIIFADYQLWVQLIQKGHLSIAGESCFNYRIHRNVSVTTNAEKYRLAFEKYLHFLQQAATTSPKIKDTVEQYGSSFLSYFTQSLSHRLLKTPPSIQRIAVTKFIDNCINQAAALNIKSFNPRKKWGILIAEMIDRNKLPLNLFRKFKGVK